MRFLLSSTKIFLTACHPEDESRDHHQTWEPFHTVYDDRHPVTAKTSRGPTVRQVRRDDAGERPGFVQVIETEENRVCHPVVLPKNSLHFGQEHAVPEKFLAQE